MASLSETLEMFDAMRSAKAVAKIPEFHDGMLWEDETDRAVMLSEFKRLHREMKKLLMLRNENHVRANFSIGITDPVEYFMLADGNLTDLSFSTKKHMAKIVRRMANKVAHLAAGGRPDDCRLRHKQTAKPAPAVALEPIDHARALYAFAEKAVIAELQDKIKTGRTDLSDEAKRQTEMVRALLACFPEIDATPNS
jgi:hypothetical protein